MRQMKDSGIEWIWSIPENWNIMFAFQCFELVKNKNTGMIESNLLSLSYGQIKRKNIDAAEGLLPESFETYNIIEKDDIVLRLTDLQNDHKSLRVGLSSEKGIITSAYLTLRNKSTNIPKYLYYYLHSFDLAKGFYGMGSGVRQGLSWDELKHLVILKPDVIEQERIVSYIDSQCYYIDSVIEKTKESIEEYKKLKQAIIAQAVTKGVRGNRAMKHSGIDWIGEIPSDWVISRVGLHFDIILGKMLCPNQISKEYTLEPYYCAANVHFDGLATDTIKEMWFSPEEKEQYAVQKGDLLVVEGGAGAGGSAIVLEADKQIYIQNSIMIVRPRKQYSNVYLRYLIEHLVKQGYIDVVCNKATIPHFTKDKLANVPFILNEEQQDIATYLDQKCTEIDNLISKKEVFLTELESYKKSIVYEYVTGKKEAKS